MSVHIVTYSTCTCMFIKMIANIVSIVIYCHLRSKLTHENKLYTRDNALLLYYRKTDIGSIN